MSSFWSSEGRRPRPDQRKPMLQVGVKTVCHTEPSQTHSQSLRLEVCSAPTCPSSPPLPHGKNMIHWAALLAERRAPGTGMEVLPGQRRRCSGGCLPAGVPRQRGL